MALRADAVDRRLEAARAFGTAGLCVLGQFAVAMPGGHFGAAEEITRAGVAYGAIVVLLMVALVIAHVERRPWAFGLSLLFYSGNLGAFLPALATDPARAGALVAWLLLGIARTLFPLLVDRRRSLADADPLAPLRREVGPAAVHLGLVALAAATVVIGYELSARRPAQAVVLALDLVALGAAAPYLLAVHRTAGSRFVLAVPGLTALALALLAGGLPAPALGVLGLANATTLGIVVAQERVTADLARAFFDQPAVLVCATFVALIALGTLVLTFPAASASGAGVPAIDALFTATSAACVTGLTTVDTGATWSTFGKAVILAVIQVGGLNIMVLSTFAALALGRRLGLRGEAALAQVLDLPAQRSGFEVTRFIVLSTLVIEGVGAALLAYAFARAGHGPLDAAWLGLFHSVSAFCNAGFALRPDSVVCFQHDPLPLVVLATLVTAGGLGFTVLASGWALVRGEHPRPIALQVKLVLAVSAALTLGGACWWLVVEWGASLRGLPLVDKLANALFQSVTLRTAGFNSVDLGACARPTIVVMIILMLIGASPGGTGGGVKTTTLGVLLGAVLSAARGGTPLVLFGRTVPWVVVYRAVAVLMMTLATAVAGLLALLHSQPGIALEALSFEVASALGTVGLTLGATPLLDVAGKLVVVGLMFAGRVGPLTLVLLFGRAPEGRVGRPEAKLMIG